jgi:hypothetical protein
MNARRLGAAALLAGGLALALYVPAHLARAVPRMAGYLLHREIFLWQAAPYLLGAALWLPWRAPAAASAALAVAALLFVASAALYVPMLLRPDALSGDMAGDAFVLVSVVACASVAVVSLAIFVAGCFRFRRAAAHGEVGPRRHDPTGALPRREGEP